MASEDLTLEDAPTSIDPYAILSVPLNASAAEIKSAYKKAALRTHPDKAPADKRDEAHKAFQSLALAYAVLSDPKRRARYDRTGSTAETLEDDDDFNWRDFFRAQYAEHVTAEKISALREEYQGSEEERKDVLKAYERGKGNFSRVVEEVMLSNVLEDEERLRKYIDDAIEKGDVKAYEKYTGESERSKERRREAARKEAKEAEEAANELGMHEEVLDKDGDSKDAHRPQKPAKKKAKTTKESEMDLAALIQGRATSRQAQATSFLDNLEAKYGGSATKGKGKKRKIDEPSEEMFAANQKKGRRDKEASKEIEDDEGLDEVAPRRTRSKAKRKV